MTTTTMPDRLPFTEIDDADRLLAEDPLALLIGLALDQQVTVQKAFSGPWELRRRLGHLDARRIADTDPDELDRVFRERPAIHRFPGSMATKVAALCAAVADGYDGDAARIWLEASDAADLRVRLNRLPGFGDMKVRTLLAILGKRFALDLPGMTEAVPRHPTLGDVDTPEALAAYQASKRAYKAEQRAESKRA